MAHLIFQNIPFWVWIILATLAMLGLRQTLTQTVSLRRVTLVPMGFVALSLYGTLGAFGSQPLAFMAWIVAALAAATVLVRQPAATGTRYDLATRTFTVPGSWAPLGLMMVIFCTKYAVGVTGAMHPDVLRNLDVALAISAVYGLCSGALAARALRLWRLAATTDAALYAPSVSQ